MVLMKKMNYFKKDNNIMFVTQKKHDELEGSDYKVTKRKQSGNKNGTKNKKTKK